MSHSVAGFGFCVATRLKATARWALRGPSDQQGGRTEITRVWRAARCVVALWGARARTAGTSIDFSIVDANFPRSVFASLDICYTPPPASCGRRKAMPRQSVNALLASCQRKSHTENLLGTATHARHGRRMADKHSLTQASHRAERQRQ